MQMKFHQKIYLICSLEEVDSAEVDSTLVPPLSSAILTGRPLYSTVWWSRFPSTYFRGGQRSPTTTSPTTTTTRKLLCPIPTPSRPYPPRRNYHSRPLQQFHPLRPTSLLCLRSASALHSPTSHAATLNTLLPQIRRLIETK